MADNAARLAAVAAQPGTVTSPFASQPAFTSETLNQTLGNLTAVISTLKIQPPEATAPHLDQVAAPAATGSGYQFAALPLATAETIRPALATLAKLTAPATITAATAGASSALRLAQVQGDFTRTEAEKWTERKTLLDDEIAAQQTFVAEQKTQRETATTSGNPTAAAVYAHAETQGEDKLATLTRKQAELGPDPNSWIQQAEASVTRLRQMWTVNAQSIAQTATGLIGGAVNSISGGITGLIMKTTTWAQAWRSVASAILTSVVNSIVQVIIQETLLAALHKMFKKNEQKDDQQGLGTKATSAGLESVSQLGPIYGIIAFGAAIAAILALTSSFAAGGLATGPGTATSDSIPARLSNGEFVMQTAAVDQYGADYMAALNAGSVAPTIAYSPPATADGTAGYAPPPVAANTPTVALLQAAARNVSNPAAASGAGSTRAQKGQKFIFVNSMKEAIREARRDPDDEAHIVDVIHRRKGELMEF
jgi:hypothetical protein